MTRGERLLTAGVLALAAAVLFVPPSRVPVVYDSIGYGAQALQLARGGGNTVWVGGERTPGFYPVGVPALLSLPLLLTGDDVRHGIASILACALGAVLATAVLARRLAGGPSPAATAAGLGAALLLLAAAGFRHAAGVMLSQVPTALAMLVVLLLLVGRGTAPRLAAAGFVAGISVLLRYGNVGLPAAVLVVLACWGAPQSGRRLRPALLFTAGLLPAAAAVLVHNQACYGSPLATGYDHWGWGAYGYHWRYALWTPRTFAITEEWPFTRAFLGLGRLYGPELSALGALGFVLLLRGSRDPGRQRARAALLCAALVASVYAVHAPYSFHSSVYLVPTIPLLCALAATALVRLTGPSRAWLAPLVAGALLVVSLWQQPPPDASEDEALVSYASLIAAAERLEPDAVLLTAAPPPLVEPIVQPARPGDAAGGREVIYLETFFNAPLRDLAQRTLGVPVVKAHRVATLVEERLAAERPVYYHRYAPPYGVEERHRNIHGVLVRRFDVEPLDVPGLSRVGWRDEEADSGTDEERRAGPAPSAAPDDGGSPDPEASDPAPPDDDPR